VVEDLSKIWDYTFEIWSENQADKYYGELISNCQEIAEIPDLGKIYKGISKQLLGMKANRHIIFYRTLNKNYVEITRILHERMDLRKRITD
jgi:toxin ParE1/3/4